MIPYEFFGTTVLMEQGERGKPGSLLFATLTFKCEIEAKDHSVLVYAKKVIGSDPSDIALEVMRARYPKSWPIGITIPADELHEAVSFYLSHWPHLQGSIEGHFTMVTGGG
jgi:hypothetical protein